MKETNGVILNILSIIVVVAMTHGIVWADNKNNIGYIQFGSGLYQPSGDIDDVGYNSGFNISVVFGKYFGKYLALEGGVGYLFSHKDSVGSSSALGSYKEEDTVDIVSIAATAKGVYPIGKVELFGGAGIGYTFVSFDAVINDIITTSDEDTVFGYHITGGLNYKFTELFFLGAEVKYLWTDDIDIRKFILDIPVGLQGGLDGYVVNITFGLRF